MLHFPEDLVGDSDIHAASHAIAIVFDGEPRAAHLAYEGFQSRKKG